MIIPKVIRIDLADVFNFCSENVILGVPMGYYGLGGGGSLPYLRVI